MEKNSEKTSILQIILPFCVECEHDSFFNIIRNAYGRLKLDSHYLDNALKSAMSGEIFVIQPDDLTMNWLQRKEISDQIRHSKILGYWASHNFPALGRKFFGASWQPHERMSLNIDGQANEIKAEEIDAIVMKKLRLRLIELDVSPSTCRKMRHFVVDVPPGMTKKNELQLSMKAKSFDFDDEYSQFCWNSLKGSRSARPISVQKQQVQEDGNDNFNNKNPSVGSKSIRAPKRIHLETSTVNTSESNDSSKSDRAPKRIQLETSTVNSGKSNESFSAERGHLEAHTTDDTDPIKAVLFEIRSEIGELSGFVRSTFTARYRESVNSHDNVHMLLINQKDEAITRLEASSQELLLSNQSLASDKSDLKEQNDRQTELIYALQKGIESTSKLQLQADRDLTSSLNAIESMKQDMERMQSEKHDLQHQADATKQELCQLRIESQQIIQENQELRNERQALKQQIAQMTSQADLDATSTSNVIDNMKLDMERMQSENNDLQHQADATKQELCQLRIESQQIIQENQELRNERQALKQQIAQKTSQADLDATSTSNVIDNMKLDMERMQSENNDLQHQADTTKQELYQLQVESQQIIQENQKLRYEREREFNVTEEMKQQMERMQNEYECVKNNNSRLQMELETLHQETDSVVAELKSSLDELRLSSLEYKSKASVETQTEVFFEVVSLTSADTESNAVVQNSTYTEQTNVFTTDKKSNCTEPNGNFHQQVVNDHSQNGSFPSNNVDKSDPQPDFETDEIVNQCRPLLQSLQFGWMKFKPTKKAKFFPAFVHPADDDNMQRAQKVTSDGYVSNTKNPFFEFSENIPDAKKGRPEVLALRKFNEKFRFSFV